MKPGAPTVAAGVISGLVFFGHAVLSDGGPWPLIWPLLGGGVAVALAARNHRLKSLWSALGAGAGAGGISALLFLVFSAIALFALGPMDDPTSAGGGATLVMLASLAAFGLALAVVAGALVFPLVRRSGRES